MRALRENQIDDVAEQEGESGEEEAQCQRGDEVEVQRPAPEDVGMRTVLTSSGLAQMPPQTERSNHRKRKTVQCILPGPTRPGAELLGEEKVADSEETGHRTAEKKSDARQGRQVVVELTESEGGSALRPLRFP